MPDLTRPSARKNASRRGLAPRLALAFLLITATVLVLTRSRQHTLPLSPPTPAGPLTLTFFDLPTGESTLIQSPSGKTILIDTGPVSARRFLTTGLEHSGVHRLDMLITTHTDSTHTGNTLLVLQHLQTASVMDSGFDTLTSAQNTLRDKFAHQTPSGVTVTESKLVGTKTDIGGGATLEYLGPLVKLPNAADNGIVLRVSLGRISILLAGDAGPGERDSLMAHKVTLWSSVLQVARPEAGTDLPFLERAQPHTIIISGGSGPKASGPDPTLPASFRGRGIRIWRTAGQGMLSLQTDGNSFHILRWSK